MPCAGIQVDFNNVASIGDVAHAHRGGLRLPGGGAVLRYAAGGVPRTECPPRARGPVRSPCQNGGAVSAAHHRRGIHARQPRLGRGPASLAAVIPGPVPRSGAGAAVFGSAADFTGKWGRRFRLPPLPPPPLPLERLSPVRYYE